MTAVDDQAKSIVQRSAAHEDRGAHVWLLAIAAAGLSAGIQVRDGLFNPRGLIGITVALVACPLIYFPKFLPRRIIAVESLGEGPVPKLFGALLIFAFFQFFTYHFPGSTHGTEANAFYYWMLAIGLGLVIAMLRWPRASRWILLALIVVFWVIGAWVIRSVPRPYMDVWMLQTEGLKAFVAGNNPFTNAFVDIYHRPELFDKAATVDGLVHQGFPYPPMVFWLELPGYAIGGDYRWSNLTAMALTAILIAHMRPGRIPPLAAALFLFTPRAFFVLESGWTEPTSILLLAAAIFCACRLPGLAPVFLGMFLCSKQYLVWAVPPLMLLAGRPLQWRKLVGIVLIALAVGCMASLPLMLWDFRAFMVANFGFAGAAGFRTDALNYLAWFADLTNHPPTATLATITGACAGSAAAFIACRRGARSPAGYATAVAFAHLMFFAFYKFAFCNYYYLIIGGLCCALGASKVGSASADGVSPIRAALDPNKSAC